MMQGRYPKRSPDVQIRELMDNMARLVLDELQPDDGLGREGKLCR